MTDIHEAMFFHADDEVTRSSFGIWSLRWSPDGKEIIAGTGDSSLYIYDVESQRVSSFKAAAGIFPSAFPAQALLCSASSFCSSHQALKRCELRKPPKTGLRDPKFESLKI